MSNILIIPERIWYLPVPGVSARNNQTQYYYGESTGANGYKFDRRGVLTKLSVIGEVNGITGGPGTWTFTVGAYTDGVAAGNKVFEVTFSGSTTSNAPFAGTDETPDGGGPGVGYGTGTDIFLKAVSTLGGFSTASFVFNIVLEGIHVA